MSDKTQPIQDIIEFPLVAETTVTNNTVRLTALLAGTVLPGMTEDDIKAQIHKVLRNFIDVKWMLSGLSRSNDTSGVEKLTLTATVRVNEAEYYALEERSHTASMNGMRITSVSADTSPPLRMIQDAESMLRSLILSKAMAERDATDQQTSRHYRIGSVQYHGDVYGAQSSNNLRGYAMTSSTYTGNPVPEAIGNTLKLTMHATVQLRCSVLEGITQ